MKYLIYGISTILAALAVILTFCWACVEFILYLVKDMPFNWWSVWTTIISFLACIVFPILMAVSKEDTLRHKRKDVIKENRLQQRLNDLDVALKAHKQDRTPGKEAAKKKGIQCT